MTLKFCLLHFHPLVSSEKSDFFCKFGRSAALNTVTRTYVCESFSCHSDPQLGDNIGVLVWAAITNIP